MECSQPLSGIKRRSQARERFHHRPVFLFPPFFLSTFQVVNLDLFVPIGVKINHLLCKDFEYENVNHSPERHLRRRIGATVKAVKASCDPVSSFGKIVWRRSAKNSSAVAKNRRHCW